MRPVLTIFLSFLLYSFVFSQNIPKSYFYNNREIYLEPDLTRISITYKTTKSKQGLQTVDRNISTLLNGRVSSAKKMYGTSAQLVELTSAVSEAQLDDYIKKLNQMTDIKMAAPVYLYHNVHQAISDEFIIRYKDNAGKNQINRLNKILGGQLIKEIAPRVFLMQISKSTGLNGLSAANLYYEHEDLVQWAEPNFIYLNGDLYNATVNDPLHGSQWAHVNTSQAVETESIPDATVNGRTDADMDVDQAWDISTGDPSIIIAIIDSGVDLDHPDLNDNLVTGADVSGDGDGPDAPGDEAHGTNCAGLVAAEGNNGIGVAGIAYSCSIMPVQIFNSAGTTTNSAIVDGINYAWQNGADILSNSWGGGSPSSAVNTAISNAKSSGRGGLGCVILFSSGNEGIGNVNYPAYLSTVIAVGASSMFDEKKNPGSGDEQFWWGGNYGAELDVVAPTICYSTDIIGSAGYTATDYYSTFNGTSAACPNAAGVVALILSVNSSLTSNDVQTILENSADKIETYPYDSDGWNKYVGYGRVNAYQAVLAAQGNDGDVPLIQHTAEQSSSSTAARTISATITDASGLVTGVNQPTLYYRLRNSSYTGPWTAVTDINGPSGDVYEFIIPAQNLGTEVEYYISATDNSAYNRTTTFPFGGNGSTAAPVLFKYWVATLSTQTYNSSDLFSWSSGAGYLNLDLSIPDDRTIIDLNFNLTFSSRAGADLTDFTMMLECPDGQRAGLVGNNSGSSYNGTVFDDEASTAITDGGTTHSGNYIGDYHLDVFDGKSTSGNWVFWIYDGVSAGGGNVSAWSVDITYTQDEDISLPVELSSFNAVSASGNARLNWTTESELNNMGFYVLRSNSKEGDYTEIASLVTNDNLKGLGTSSVGRNYTFTDYKVTEEKEYWYKIIDVDYSGNRDEHGPVHITIEKYDGLKAISGFIPKKFNLEQNYPNPFNPATRFIVNIPQSGTEINARIAVYDILGKKVKELFNGVIAPGQYRLSWDGTNNQGTAVNAGMYIYTFTSNKFNSAKRMLLLK